MLYYHLQQLLLMQQEIFEHPILNFYTRDLMATSLSRLHFSLEISQAFHHQASLIHSIHARNLI